MKKIVMIAMITFISKIYAFEDLQSTKPARQESSGIFLDAASLVQEDIVDNNALSLLDEYDHNITNNVTPPKVSTAEVLFKQALGAVLVKYINVREAARGYFQEFKNVVAQWYHNMIN